jgi:hypothetical protein
MQATSITATKGSVRSAPFIFIATRHSGKASSLPSGIARLTSAHLSRQTRLGVQRIPTRTARRSGSLTSIQTPPRWSFTWTSSRARALLSATTRLPRITGQRLQRAEGAGLTRGRLANGADGDAGVATKLSSQQISGCERQLSDRARDDAVASADSFVEGRQDRSRSDDPI